MFGKRIDGVPLTIFKVSVASIATERDEYFKKNIIEFGGSNPIIILNDGVTDKAIKWAVVGRINNNGEC